MREANAAPVIVRRAAVIVLVPSKFSVEPRDLVRRARWLEREARLRRAAHQRERLAGGRPAAGSRATAPASGAPPFCDRANVLTSRCAVALVAWDAKFDMRL